eukprot:CAMPEP_0185920744 /NCGR_PEP_ID=MMETSP0924C-20121207/8270_1 /TAXON_ID=321610 /ORGANISM="Perkinsus chesapeaki, Strain ATCC PRA-65" /LENGTH=36 /DNA_ID= /DNA_START= /DNA_END= /DNA_ORIENTATION=
MTIIDDDDDDEGSLKRRGEMEDDFTDCVDHQYSQRY